MSRELLGVPGVRGKKQAKQAVYAIAGATVSKEGGRELEKGLEKPSAVFLAFHRESWLVVRLTTEAKW